MTDHNRLVEKTAKKLNLPEEQVRIVMQDTWMAIRKFLSNPLQSFNVGVFIKKFCRITINIRRLHRKLEKGEYRGKKYNHGEFLKIYNNFKNYEQQRKREGKTRKF